MKKNPRYKEKLLSTNEPQAHLLVDPNGLPPIHAPNNQRKPIIPAGEKGIVKITNPLYFQMMFLCRSRGDIVSA